MRPRSALLVPLISAAPAVLLLVLTDTPGRSARWEKHLRHTRRRNGLQEEDDGFAATT